MKDKKKNVFNTFYSRTVFNTFYEMTRIRILELEKNQKAHRHIESVECDALKLAGELTELFYIETSKVADK